MLWQKLEIRSYLWFPMKWHPKYSCHFVVKITSFPIKSFFLQRDCILIFGAIIIYFEFWSRNHITTNLFSDGMCLIERIGLFSIQYRPLTLSNKLQKRTRNCCAFAAKLQEKMQHFLVRVCNLIDCVPIYLVPSLSIKVIFVMK